MLLCDLKPQLLHFVCSLHVYRSTLKHCRLQTYLGQDLMTGAVQLGTTVVENINKVRKTRKKQRN